MIQLNDAEVIALLREYKESFISIRDFAKLKGINDATLRSWVRKTGLPIRNNPTGARNRNWEAITTGVNA